MNKNELRDKLYKILGVDPEQKLEEAPLVIDSYTIRGEDKWCPGLNNFETAHLLVYFINELFDCKLHELVDYGYISREVVFSRISLNEWLSDKAEIMDPLFGHDDFWEQYKDNIKIDITPYEIHPLNSIEPFYCREGEKTIDLVAELKDFIALERDIDNGDQDIGDEGITFT